MLVKGPLVWNKNIAQLITSFPCYQIVPHIPVLLTGFRVIWLYSFMYLYYKFILRMYRLLVLCVIFTYIFMIYLDTYIKCIAYWFISQIVFFYNVPLCSPFPLTYHQTSNIRRTWVGSTIVDHSNVVAASPVGAASTTSSFFTSHLASMEWAKTTARQDEKHLNLGIWCNLY